ncbi:hypothetical protein XF_0270 [Xylella fastidiosa 9a5c]|uniref:Uncharacterized protein n=1 Tax=Xylella fastidiosa (strain 9a5c) TaxID=160492 RepID=Q9PGM8_XYLFA|nr:hypothetical protein XF_0270 [Xylella fastidiosa 9a5c]
MHHATQAQQYDNLNTLQFKYQWIDVTSCINTGYAHVQRADQSMHALNTASQT